MINFWNENNRCLNAGELINHAVRTKLAQKTYKVIKLKQLASWAGISPTKLLLLRILCNKITIQYNSNAVCSRNQHNSTTKENSQAIKVLQLSKFFREITRQVVAGDVTVHLKNSSDESYICTITITHHKGCSLTLLGHFSSFRIQQAQIQ